MNWSLYSSCICVVPVHLSGSVFIFILCTCYICYTQVNKETWTFKTSLLDGKVWEQLTLSAVLGVWSYPDRACPGPSDALLAVPQDQPHAVNDSIPEGDLVKVDILGKAACP